MDVRILLGLVCTAGCLGERLATTMRPVRVVGHGHVRIAAADATIRVVTAEIDQVELRVEAHGYDLPREVEVAMTPHGDQVDIIARTHPRRAILSRRSLRLEVRMPRDADLESSSGDGSVEVAQVLGNVDIRTGGGRIAILGGRGTIRLRTGDGSIEGRELNGSVYATTGDGGVTLSGRFDVLVAQTRDGPLVATAAPGSRVLEPWLLQSGDGSVELGLPWNLGAHIEASTGDGPVTSSIPLQQLGRSRVAGDVNGGGLPIVVRTGDGPIQLSQR